MAKMMPFLPPYRLVDMSDSKHAKAVLCRADDPIAWISHQRSRQAPWYGWRQGDGHRFGPFQSRAEATRWLRTLSKSP